MSSLRVDHVCSIPVTIGAFSLLHMYVCVSMFHAYRFTIWLAELFFASLIILLIFNKTRNIIIIVQEEIKN